MKYRTISIISFLVFSINTSLFALEDKYINIVQPFVNCVKTENIEELSKLIRYPLKRLDPLLSIDSPEEFLRKHNEIFDDKLVQAIVDSDINTDWHEMNGRGIMLSNGYIWLNYNGMVTAVNYESAIEATRRAALIKEMMRRRANPQIEQASESQELPANREIPQTQEIPEVESTPELPTLEWKTKKHRIQIKCLETGEYQYTAWPVEKEFTENPALVLINGQIKYDESGTNHYYEFVNGSYKYQCWVTASGEEPQGYLKVYRSGELMSSEPFVD